MDADRNEKKSLEKTEKKKVPINEQIRIRRIEKRLSMQRLGDMVGVSSGTICRIESGDVKTIKSGLAAKLSKALNIPIGEFYGQDGQDAQDVQRQQAYDVFEGASKINLTKEVPIIERIGCGKPTYGSDYVVDTFMMDENFKDGDTVAIMTKGDSMEPRIFEGDIAIIRLQPMVESGNVAALRIGDDELLLKKVHFEETGLRLESYNKENYPDIFYEWNDVRNLPVTILGKLVYIIGRF